MTAQPQARILLDNVFEEENTFNKEDVIIAKCDTILSSWLKSIKHPTTRAVDAELQETKAKDNKISFPGNLTGELVLRHLRQELELVRFIGIRLPPDIQKIQDPTSDMTIAELIEALQKLLQSEAQIEESDMHLRVMTYVVCRCIIRELFDVSDPCCQQGLPIVTMWYSKTFPSNTLISQCVTLLEKSDLHYIQNESVTENRIHITYKYNWFMLNFKMTALEEANIARLPDKYTPLHIKNTDNITKKYSSFLMFDKDLKEIVEKHQTRKQKLEQILRDARDELMSQREELDKRIQELEEEKEATNKQIINFVPGLQVDTEKEELQKKLEEAEEKAEALQAKIDECEAKKAEVSQQLEVHEQTIDQLKQYTQLQVSLIQKSKQLINNFIVVQQQHNTFKEQSTEEQIKLQTEIKELQRKESAQEQELIKLRTQKATIENEEKLLKDQQVASDEQELLRQKDEELVNVRTKIAGLEQRILAEMQMSKTAREELQDVKEEARRKETKYEDDIKELKLNVDAIYREGNELISRYQEVITEFENTYTQENTFLLDENNELKEKLNQEIAAKEQLIKRVQELNKLITQKDQAFLKELQSFHKSSTQTYENLQRKYFEIKEEMNRINQLKDKAKRLLAQDPENDNKKEANRLEMKQVLNDLIERQLIFPSPSSSGQNTPRQPPQPAAAELLDDTQ